MKIIKESSENEMLLEYLKSEINSKRFGEKLKNTLADLNISPNIILNGNIEDEYENTQRKLLMKKFREYPTGDIFERFPKEFKWYFVEFEKDDFDKIFYLNWPCWNERTNNTAKPEEAAKNILNGIEFSDIPNAKFLNGLDYLEKGGKFDPIIAVTCNGEKMVLIEGHSRVTVYALKPDFFVGTYGYVGFCSKEDMKKYDSRII